MSSSALPEDEKDEGEGEGAHPRRNWRSIKARLEPAVLIYPLLKHANFFIIILYLVLTLGVLVLPTGLLGRKIYVSENALQPAQVNVYWGWQEVHHFNDLYDEILARFARTGNHTRPYDLEKERARWVREQFQRRGLDSAVQTFVWQNGEPTRYNTYGILQATRSEGTEAIVINAPWLSKRMLDGEYTLNAAGVALSIMMAEYTSRYSFWSKDIIFLISEGHVQGTAAWLESYNSVESSETNLSHRAGEIRAAICLDLPGKMVEGLGIQYIGPNGRLPNLDFINTVHLVAKYQTGIDITLNNDPLNDCHRSTVGKGVLFHRALDRLQQLIYPRWIAELLLSPLNRMHLHNYLQGLDSLYTHLKWSHTGSPQGAHAAFLGYGISALTIRGFTNADNSGYWSFLEVGRVIEGTMRSLNNLLERFHQSYFLFVLIGLNRFVSVADYISLPLAGAAISLLTSLEVWYRCGLSRHGKASSRPVVGATLMFGAFFISGLGLFSSFTMMKHQEGPAQFLFWLVLAAVPIVAGLLAPLEAASVLAMAPNDMKECFTTSIRSSGALSKAEKRMVTDFALTSTLPRIVISFLLFYHALLISALSVLNFSEAWLIPIWLAPTILVLRQEALRRDSTGSRHRIILHMLVLLPYYTYLLSMISAAWAMNTEKNNFLAYYLENEFRHNSGFLRLSSMVYLPLPIFAHLMLLTMRS